MGLEIIAAVATIAGTAASISSSNKAAKAQKSQLDAQRRMADLENAKQRREAVRQARIARGQVLAQGEGQGVATSSGVAGGVAGVQQQMGYNLSFLDQSNQLNSQAAVFGQQAADYSSQASVFGSIANTAYGMGGKEGLQDFGASVFNMGKK